MDSTWTTRSLAIVAIALIIGACARSQRLPAGVYEGHLVDDYERLAPQLKTTEVDLLYMTDRTPEHDEEGNLRYGIGRSQSLAFGSVVIDLDEGRTWDEFVTWTRGEGPESPAPTTRVVSTTELGRFPATPLPLTVDDAGQVISKPEIEEQEAEMAEAARTELRRRLALTDHKFVNVNIHGVRTDFARTAKVLAMAYHQRGRRGVPIYYSWPAGGPGFVRGYSYDRESGEFTIFHLKQLLRALGKFPEAEDVNLFAHSRGTDILISAIRELVIEARGAGLDPREAYNFGHVVLIAPDMDMEVISQRVAADGVLQGVKHVTVYASDDDWAIGFARSLFSSKRRLGQLNPESLNERQLKFVRKLSNVDIVFYKGSGGGGLGHAYYNAPEVRADMMLLGLGHAAGAEHGRPLEPVAPHLWIIRDDYSP